MKTLTRWVHDRRRNARPKLVERGAASEPLARSWRPSPTQAVVARPVHRRERMTPQNLPSETPLSPAHEDSTARAQQGARWLWWSLLGGVIALFVIVTVAAVVRGRDGEGNRGPADEAAPGAHPSRDIDRTLNR